MPRDLSDEELRAFARSTLRRHDPAQQSHPYDGRCELCGFIRHPCDTFDLAEAVIELLDR